VLAAIAVAQLLIARVVWGAMVQSASRKATALERLAAYRTATVVAFALRESTALIGLVLTLLGGDLRWCLGLSTLAVVAMLAGWPRRADMVRLAADPDRLPIG
jgi:F0F1-type ATP synthase membrane subunit c/vacuolar-type H+-ATPase subunit K